MNILFDLDGTLTDSKRGILASMNHALLRLGREALPEEELKWCLGPPLQRNFARLLDTDDEREISTAVAIYRERFADQGLYENEVYAGIPDLLETLCGQGVSLYVATSKVRLYTDRILDHFDLGKYFHGVYGSEMDGTLSDKGELIAHILEREELSTEATWMIGDREHDIIGARANNVRSVGALWGYGSSEELSAAGADHLCRRPNELPSFVTPSPL